MEKTEFTLGKEVQESIQCEKDWGNRIQSFFFHFPQILKVASDDPETTNASFGAIATDCTAPS